MTRCSTVSVSVSVWNWWPFAVSSVRSSLEILDDAVVHDGDALVHVRMGVALHRLAVRGPARVADAGAPLQGLVGEPQLQVLELALGAPAVEVAVLDGGDARQVIAAVFQPPQRIDEVARDRLLPENADDPAHASNSLLSCPCPERCKRHACC